MSLLTEQIQIGLSKLKSIPCVVDAKVKDPSELINRQIGYEPSMVFVLDILTYVSLTPAVIKFVMPISVILRPNIFDNFSNDILMNIAHGIASKPFDNPIDDHAFNDNLTDRAFTLYVDPNDEKFDVIILKGVRVQEYQDGTDYDNLLDLIKQQPHVKNVVGNIVVDPKLIPIQNETFIAFTIETDIFLKNSIVAPNTLIFMIIFNVDQLNLTDNILKEINERIEEYINLLQ